MVNRRLLHHLVLAVTALFFFLSSNKLSLSQEFIALAIAVFIGTLFIYRLSVWVPILSSSSPFIHFYCKPLKLEIAAFFILLVSTFYFLSLYEIILLVCWGLFSTFYFLNIKLGAFHFKGLRSIPLIKTIHLALLWTIIGFIFALPQVAISKVLIFDFSIRFLILFLICLGVDLRDIAKDQETTKDFKIVTLATLFGFHKLKQLMLFVNLTLICLIMLFSPNSMLEVFIASLLFIELILLKINSRTNTFTILMDGTLLLYSFLAFMIQLTNF